MSDDPAATKLETALSIVEASFPNAVAVLAAMDVRLDDRVETACVTPSGRMLVSPAFARSLPLRHLVFVVAHELYHVLYGVFDRFGDDTPAPRRRLVNIAHDFIVNDMLEKKFCGNAMDNLRQDRYYYFEDEDGIPPEVAYIPKEGLFWADFRNDYEKAFDRSQPPIGSYTIESLVLELERMQDALPDKGMLERMLEGTDAGKGEPPPPPNGLGAALDALGDLGLPPGESDGDAGAPASPEAPSKKLPELLAAAEEAALFPDETAVERAARRERVFEALELADVRNILCNQLATRGGGPGNGDYLVRSLDGTWSTPWERALQKWFDDTAPPVRSWAKASRRAGDRADVVLPGRLKDGWILNVVADTSGSMGALLPAVFGLLRSFGRTAGVRAARIVQCDSDVVADEIVDIDDLDTVEVKGLGGGMDPPGLLRMAEDPSVESVLVLTDGYIEIPPKEAVPYDVLWCLLCAGGDTSHFVPDYGTVMSIPAEELVARTEEIP